jgi:Flp pilus assembly protein TadG
MTLRLCGDRGSTIPFVLGIFILALLLVAGSVAAGDAFVQQSSLQDDCDGAALAAASSADLDGARTVATGSRASLQLAQVQLATEKYVSRLPSSLPISMRAALTPDRGTVVIDCVVTRPIAFGAWFGFSGGITHHVTASARARVQPG